MTTEQPGKETPGEPGTPVSPPTTADGPVCCMGGGRRWLWLALLLGIAVVVVVWDHIRPGTASSDQGIVWRSDYAQALAQAGQENKPVLLAFHAEWCGPCQEMKRTTYHDPQVIKVVEPFVRVMIDVDKEAAIAQQYEVSGIPTYVILAPDGAVKARFVGAADADDFVKELQEGLQATKTTS
jgi:thiol:disulfide interchange protein